MLIRRVHIHDQTAFGSAFGVQLAEDRIMLATWCLRGFITVSLLVLAVGCEKDADTEPAGISFTYCTTDFTTIIENNDEGQGYAFEGELCMDDYRDPDRDIHIANIVVRYDLSRFFGEPLHKYFVSWEQGDDPEFGIYHLKFRARVKLQNTVQTVEQSAYKTFIPGTIPSPGEGFGTDIYGSPNWNALFRNDSGTYLSADEAKAIFDEGFELVDLEITELNN